MVHWSKRPEKRKEEKKREEKKRVVPRAAAAYGRQLKMLMLIKCNVDIGPVGVNDRKRWWRGKQGRQKRKR